MPNCPNCGEDISTLHGDIEIHEYYEYSITKDNKLYTDLMNEVTRVENFKCPVCEETIFNNWKSAKKFLGVNEETKIVDVP